MTKDEALDLAQKALEDVCGNRCNAEYNPCFQREAITAIKAALEAKDDPVAWSEEIIDDLHALYDSEMIKENDSGDALIRLDEAVCVVEEVAQRNTNLPKQKAKDEPVAWREFDGEGGYDYYTYEHNEDLRDKYIERNGEKYASWVEPLYTEPPQPVIDESAAKRIATALGWEPKRKPLTDEEINSVRYKRDWTAPWTDTTFARAIEAAHGIKGEAK